MGTLPSHRRHGRCRLRGATHVLFALLPPMLLGAVSETALAQPAATTDSYHLDWLQRSDRTAEPRPDQLKLINYFFTRLSLTNLLPDPSGLRGVSLGPIGVGAGVGSATRVDGADSTNWIAEQRWIPVLSYAPHFVDGLAVFRAQFEVDFAWGQAANQIQNNRGGGLNADQVNLQTKNLQVGVYPTRDPGELAIQIGTQSLYDTLYDPTITSLFFLVKTGYKLSFLGTDGTGVSAYGNLGGRWRLSAIPMNGGQPDRATDNDPRFQYAYLLAGDYGYEISPGTVVAASLWHLRDDTQGSAFAFEGLVPAGPASPSLGLYTGVQRFNLDDPSGHVTYAGLNFHHNLRFSTGDLAASGFLMVNAGRFESNRDDTALLDAVDVFGAAANLEVMWNYGFTAGDTVTAETMVTTGDSDPTDDDYSSAFTMNYYGIPGAVYFDHETLLLFPFIRTVSNYTGAINDISNQGYGLTSLVLSAKKDLIPNILNLKLGAAYAQSWARPAADDDGPRPGRPIGAEVNAELLYEPRYLMTVGLHAGLLFTGSFYDGNDQVDGVPFATFTTFTWYAF